MPEITKPNNHPIAGDKRKQRLLNLAGLASVGAAVFLFIIKAIAWFHTGSVAMLGSLLDSLLDFIASTINLFFLRSAMRPVDHEHRFGHGKAEPLGGILQAILICGSALFLISEAVRRIIEPRLPEDTLLGIIIMLVSCVVVGLLVAFQRYTIRQTGSLIVTGDALHGFGDLVINLGVVAALLLSDYLDAPIIDPVVAIALAAVLIRGAWHIAIESIHQLMDREFSEEERNRIRDIALQHPMVANIHDLRTRRAGFDAFIQLHIELPGDIDLTLAHKVADEVEHAINAAFPDAEVFIHQDPKGLERVDPFLRS